MARVFILLALCCALLAAADADSVTVSAAGSDLEQALHEFKSEVETLGIPQNSLRPDAKLTGTKPAWHGRLFENFRNNTLDAVPHEIRQRGGDNSLLQRNQFGFNISGPVIIPHLVPQRNNTFFSLSYEGVRERIGRTYLRTVPTLAERTGDFSQTVEQAGNPLPIYDPATTRLNPNYDASQPVSASNLQYLRDPFNGNRVPVSRLDAVARQAVNLYPEPNASVGPFFQNNFFINAPETNTADGFLGKIDQSLGSHHRLTLAFNLSNGHYGAAQWFQTAANPGPPDRDFQNRDGSLQYVYTLSARTVNTASFAASMNTSRSRTAGTEPFPVYRIDPYLNFGTSFPQSRIARNAFSGSDSLSTIRGKHSLTVSGQWRHSQVNVFWPQYPSGYFNFSSGLTSLPGIVNTGHAFASFLLGSPDYAEQTLVESPSYFRQSYGSLSASDKYQLAKGVTVTVAFNLTRHGPRTEKYNRQSTVDPQAYNPANGLPGALVFAGRDGTPGGLRAPIVAVDPSIGIAWNPGGTPNTVIHASYSRSHEQMPIYSGQWSTQGFNARQAILSQNSQLTPAVYLSTGLPALPNALPNLSADAANGAVADWMDLTGREPVYQSVNVSLEQQILQSLVVSAGAYYQGGRDLYVGNGSANPNAINPAALVYRDQLNDQNFSAGLRPFPQYTSFDLFSSYPLGRYQRDAAFLQVEKRASNGLSFRAYYEFAKQMDDYSGPYGIQDLFNRRNDWALTPYSSPQQLQLTYAYELPFGSNKPLLNFSDWRRPLVNGWSLTGTAYFDNGTPLVLHPQFNNTGGVITGLTVNAVAGVDSSVAQQGPNLWFNPAAFDQPADFTMGSASRTVPNLLSPSSHAYDLSVVKRIQIGLDRSVEFTATGFNFINHADWNYPDTTIGPASAPNVNAGKIIGSHGGRVIQLGLTCNF